jgi:hypothetical protein
MQNMNDDVLEAEVAQTQVWIILQHNGFYPYISYWDIMPTMQKSVNGSNHGYTFFMTFCSQMKLNFPRTVLPTQGIHTLRCMEIHMR